MAEVMIKGSFNPLEDVQQALKNEGIDIQKEENTAKELNTGKEYTDFEQQQIKKGWNPNGRKTAEEWADAEPLADELRKRSSELKQMKRTIDELKEFMSKQEDAAYKRALADITARKEEAVRRGDVSTFQSIEKEQEELKPIIANKAVPAAVKDFLERNESWLNGSSFEEMEMAAFAKQRDMELAARKMSPDEHMKVLEEHIRKKFPNFFSQDENDSELYNTVEVGYGDNVSSSSSKSKKISFRDLTKEQRQVAKDFEAMGVMSVEDYIKQVAKLGDTKNGRR